MFGGFGRAANEVGELMAGALAGRNAKSLLFRQFDELAGVLGPVIAGGLAAVGIGQLVSSSVKRAMSAETMGISMEVLIGDADKAKATIADLRSMAAATPFEFPDLADATKTLLGFGIANEDALPTISRISEVAQGSAEKLGRLSLVYGQIASTGRLMGQDLLQLINVGFNPLQIISEKTGESMIDLKKRMEQGAVSFAEVEEAFRSVTGEGGRFYQMNERQSKTTAGLFSTLRDVWGEVQLAFGEPINDAIRPMISAVIPLVASLKDEAKAFGEAIKTAMQTMVAFFEEFSMSEIGALVLNNLVLAFKASINILWAGLNGAVAAFGQAMVEYVKYVINVFSILTKPDFWSGMKDALISIAYIYGAVMLESIARDIELLKRIPGVSRVLGNPEEGMRDTATKLREQAGISGASALDQLSPFLQQYGEGLRDGLGRIAEAAQDGFNNSSEIWDTSSEKAKNAEAQKRLEERQKAMAAVTQSAPKVAAAAQMATGGATASAGGRAVGSLASAINLIMGRSANEMIYEEARKQTTVQKAMDDKLSTIAKNTAKPQTPARPIAIDNTARFSPA
jgi:tape measure domain-containing protein